MNNDSTKPRRDAKPTKPWPDFPLYAHGNGQWAKKIRGRTHFFGAWRDPQAAYKRYLSERGDLEAGRTPTRTETVDGLTVKALVNLCLDMKETQVESGELKQRTYEEYRGIGARIVRVFGANRLVDELMPADFLALRKDFAKTHKSLASLAGDIGKSRMFFNFAYTEGYIDRPVRYGQGFKKPSQAALRRERQARPPRRLTAEEIHLLLGKARPQLAAMILLGINCGYGNTDCAMLCRRHINGEWLDMPRPKTGVPRHIPLWPETQEAIKQALVVRKEPKNKAHRGRVFITSRRQSWEPEYVHDSPISKEFAKLREAAGLDPGGCDFYALRHTFATVGKKTKDNDAVRAILGHVVPTNDMLARYDEAPVDEDRLRAVTDYVRAWFVTDTKPPSRHCCVFTHCATPARRSASRILSPRAGIVAGDNSEVLPHAGQVTDTKPPSRHCCLRRRSRRSLNTRMSRILSLRAGIVARLAFAQSCETGHGHGY